MPFDLSAASAIAICVVLVSAYQAGRLARLCRQPAVIGELIAGVVLGPTLFGWLWPTISATVFTPQVTSLLAVVARVAVAAFMLQVGAEIDLATLAREAGGTARIAAVSMLGPFAIGCALAVALYPSMHGPTENRLAFILFFGTLLSVTALPVLSRILRDWNMVATRIGTMALGCAAFDDVAAWTVLGVLVAIVRTRGSVLALGGGVVLYLAVMFGVVRLWLAQAVALKDRHPQLWTALVVLLTIGSAIASDRVGIHEVFGAFAAGLCLPRRGEPLGPHTGVVRRMTALLMPAFFVLVGVKTDLRMVATGSAWMVALAITAAGCIGKIGCATLAARAAGSGWREALAIGALLNTRGLVALVVLDVGRGLGILSSTLVASFVVMIFISTFATSPLLQALRVVTAVEPSRP